MTDDPCPFCGSAACNRACANPTLADEAAAYPDVQAQGQHLYAAYVAGLGPLAIMAPRWAQLTDRQQYAWRCVVRAPRMPGTPGSVTPGQVCYEAFDTAFPADRFVRLQWGEQAPRVQAAWEAAAAAVLALVCASDRPRVRPQKEDDHV